MDAERWRMVERVLDVALESDPDEWQAILDEQCSDDPALRREVEALLARYRTAQTFLDSPPAAAAAALSAEAERAASDLGRRIGAWRLMRQIGQGGTARVFLAERADGQFTQQVALKLLRPGHDSDIDRSRFRAERQILASLSHPGIARLLDGGVTDEGLPYLVMELVDGEPIDRYCEARRLTARERLAMFLTIAEATQYAHRCLVVHRDLKPSNILVTADGQVKLLDFGLAKLLETHEPDVDPTVHTTHRWMTPEYAAPEQVRGERATTLTDVYQLGTVLYELLTGHLPFGTRSQRPYELEQAIVERDPPAPSSARRSVRGDLDAIILKALRKEPEQRYASVAAFAEDVHRHLTGEPVLARRQTTRYRAIRFVRRHSRAVAAGAFMILLMAGYAATVTVQRASVARALAESKLETQKLEQVTNLLLGLFQASEQGVAYADTVTAREILNRGMVRARELVDQPLVRAQMLDVVGQLQSQLGDHDRARATLEVALTTRRAALGADHADVSATLHNLADVAYRGGDFTDAISLHREVLAIRQQALGRSHPLTLRSLYSLAWMLHESGDTAAARPLHDQWIAAVAEQPSETSPVLADQLVDLGRMLEMRGDLNGAERLYRQALAMRRTMFDARHPGIGAAVHLLGNVARAKGVLGESERLLREAVSALRTASPHDHAELAGALRSLGFTLQTMQRWDEAAAVHAEVEALIRGAHGADDALVGTAMQDVSDLHRRRGSTERAEPYLREAIRIYAAQLGDAHPVVVRARIELGNVLWANGDRVEAESLLLDAYAALRDGRVPGAVAEMKDLALESLVKLYEAQGRESEAARYRHLIEPL